MVSNSEDVEVSFVDLRELTSMGGIQAGEIVLIGGSKSVGKTIFDQRTVLHDSEAAPDWRSSFDSIFGSGT